MQREAQVVCVLIPRFTLLTAVGERRDLLREPLALAPEPDREQVVGEVSGAAEAHGIHPGMRLGEALARCPGLRLVPPDPERAAGTWEAVLAALEGIGAAVEPATPGEAYFDAGGAAPDVRRASGGRARAHRARRSRCPPGWARRRAASARSRPRARARPGRGSKIVPAGAERAFLAPLPVSLLPGPLASASCAPALERLGVRTLGELAALPRGRRGRPLRRAAACARASWRSAATTPLRPRPPGEVLAEEIDLPEAVSGIQLQRALELLIDRLLARPERRGRALRRLRLGARFVERGTWRREVALRQATRLARAPAARARRPRLAELPAPIEQLALAVVAFGPPVADQLSFHRPDEQSAAGASREALRQTRAAAGSESVLRVLDTDPGSRIPERRAFLTPFPE